MKDVKNGDIGLLSKLKERDCTKNIRKSNSRNFSLYQTEILAALEAGYFAKDIWEALKEDKKILGSYDTFRRALNNFLKQRITQYLSIITKEEKEDKKANATKEVIADKQENLNQVQQEKPQTYQKPQQKSSLVDKTFKILNLNKEDIL